MIVGIWRGEGRGTDLPPLQLVAARCDWLGDATLEATAKHSTVKTPEHLEAHLTRFQ